MCSIDPCNQHPNPTDENFSRKFPAHLLVPRPTLTLLASPLTARTNITLIEVEVFNSVQRLLWKFSKGNMETTQQWQCAAVLQNSRKLVYFEDEDIRHESLID